MVLAVHDSMHQGDTFFKFYLWFDGVQPINKALYISNISKKTKEPRKKNIPPLLHSFINKNYFKFSVTVYVEIY